MSLEIARERGQEVRGLLGAVCGLAIRRPRFLALTAGWIDHGNTEFKSSIKLVK